MSKARLLADFISTGAGTGILADGAIDTTEITGVTVSSAEINRLSGVSGDVQTQINAKANTSSLAAVATSGAYADVTGTPSLGTAAALNVGTAANNIPQLDSNAKLPAIDGSQLTGLGVTQGTLTKTFVQNETANITLGQAVTPAPVVSVTKEVPQTGVSTKGNWDVNSTASNYDFHDTATNVTLTPSTSPDLASSTYANVSLGITGSYGPRFSSDGTKVFMNNQGQNYIRQSTLSTPWDISTRTGVASFSTASQVTDDFGFCFSDNGLHFYLADANYSSGQNLLHQYSITSGYPYDLLNYGSFTRTLNLTNLGETSPSGGAVYTALVEDSGTKMYIFTGTGSAFLIRQYTLSTPYDISSATYANKSFDVYADYGSGGYPSNSSLSSDGTVLLLANGADDIVMQYELSTAWDISTASRVGTYNPSEDANVSGIHLRPDNSEFFMLGGSNGKIYKYTLGSSPSLALGSGSFASTDVGKRIVGNGGDVTLTSTGGAFTTTGGSAFTDNSTIAAGSWSMFGLKSAGDADGITMTSFSQTGTGFDSSPPLLSRTPSSMESVYFPNLIDCCVSKNGVYFYTINQATVPTISQFTMSTPYDLSTATFTNNRSGDNGGNSRSGIAINNDGTKFYNSYTSGSTAYIGEYTFGTAYDITTLTNTSNYSVPNGFGSSVSTNSGGKFTWSADGTKAYYMPYNYYSGNSTVGHTSASGIQSNSGVVWQYTVSTPFAWNTRSTSVSTVRVPLRGDNYAMALVTSDGKWLINAMYNHQYMYVYPLTTPYDITTQVVASETRVDISLYNSSGNAINHGSIGGDHVNGIFFKASYTMKRIDANAYGTEQLQFQPTGQYNVAVTNNGGRIDSSSFVDINSMTAAQSAGTGTVHYAVSTDGRTTWSVAKGTDGVRPIVRNNSGTWQYNNHAGTSSASYYNLSVGSYDNKSFSVTTQTSSPREVQFNNDGTKMYVLSDNTDRVWEYNLSTAFDVSSASYSNSNVDVSSQMNGAQGFTFNNNGTKMYVVGEYADAVFQYSLSTAYDLSSTSYTNVSFSIGGQQGTAGQIVFNGDGTKMFLCGENEDYIRQYTLTSGFDLSTASLASGSFDHSSQSTTVTGMAFNGDGTKMFLASRASEHKVYQYSLSSAYDVSSASYDSVSLDISSQFAATLQGIVFNNDGSKMYGMDNGGTVFQYSTGGTVLSYATTATWANGTVNDELYTLQEALGAQAFNRMDKTQLDAVADANHFPTGSSLDLMIALRMDATASTLPTSDGVTLNYDAAALNEGAVLGTDYDFFFPSSTKVQIKSLAAQNLKVRVV